MTAATRTVFDRDATLDQIRTGVTELTGPIHVVARYHLDPRDAEHTAAHDASPGVRQGTRKKGKGRTARTRVGTVPSLLDQLGRMLEPAVSGEATSSGGSFESSPPLALDAIDVYARIAVEAWSLLIWFRPDVAVARHRQMARDRLDRAVNIRAHALTDLSDFLGLLRAAYGERALTLSRHRIRHHARNRLVTVRQLDQKIAELRLVDTGLQRQFDKLAAARSARDVRNEQLRSVAQELAVAQARASADEAAGDARTLREIATLVTLHEDATSYVATWQREIDTIVGRIAGSQSPTVPVLALNGIAPQLPDWQVRRIAADVARWVDTARIAARAEPAPAPVNEPCPVCGKPNSVIVRGDRDTSTAECRNPDCGARFEHWQMGMFARLVSERQTLARLAADTEITRKDEAVAVIRAALDASGMTKTRLAELVEVSETQIYRVLSPTRKWSPSESLLHRMAAAIHTHQHEGASA